MEELKTGARTLTDEERVALAADVPLPPENLDDELDNAPAANAPKPAAPVEVATLDFVDGPLGKRIVLRHPFRWEGRVVSEITVRPLTVAETSAVIEGVTQGRTFESLDFYAVMTGLPAAVLRALPGQDGEEVTAAAYGFLPRFMRDDASSPIPGDGGA